jgi:hypothetical protein
MGKDMLMNTLDKSKTIHERLNLMISENYDALREREKSLAEAKANLYINPDDLAMQNFYTIEFDYENQKKTLQKLESIRNSMNFKKIYFTMAYESEMAHNIKGAIEAFRIAESFGLDPDYARREILRLQGKYKGNL